MKNNSWICLLIGILFLVGMASADLTITGGSDTEWLIANGADTAKMTVNVVNTSTGIPASGAIVTYTVVDPTYGSFPTTSVPADASGVAIGTFKVNKTSGTATIIVSATYTDTSTMPSTISTSTTPLSITQNIDHGSAYKPLWVHNATGTVKSIVSVELYLLDRYNNAIDNRKPNDDHNVTLHIHGPGIDDCGFVEGPSIVHDISQTLDSGGKTIVFANLTSKKGTNAIILDSFGSMSDQYAYIDAVPNGIPFYIDPVYSPDSPARVPATTNPDDRFTIHFTLYDQYMNPTQDQQIWINTTDNLLTPENQTLLTSMEAGTVWFYYGPKPFAGSWIMTATPVMNASAANLLTNTYPVTKTLEFVNTSPSNLELVITPQTMASLDVPSIDGNPRKANLMVKVVDDLGNPVGGETVEIEIGATPTFSCSACWDSSAYSASFSPTASDLQYTAVTGGDGTATIPVYPGGFIVDRTNANFEETATGSVVITAKWESVQRQSTLVWKNYPYLSAVTTILPSQVKTGETVDVNLKLNGDGWALARKPIDVVLVNDRSGSMGEGADSKTERAKTAAKAFVDSMSSQDMVGLASFGVDGTSKIEKYKTLLVDSAARTSVKDVITSYTKGVGTPMRSGIVDGTAVVEDTPRVGAVKALIVLTDGEWNNCGDPQGSSTACSYTSPESISSMTNVITWSANKKNKLYFIGLGVKTGYNTTLNNYATLGGGKYYYAPESSDLTGIYKEIAGELVEEAGVETTANLDFGSILVNDVYDTSGAVFEYVGDPTVMTPVKPYNTNYPDIKGKGSTMVDKYNKTVNTSAEIVGDVFHFFPSPDYTDIGPLLINQTDYWNANDHQLYFNIGAVKVNETWETNFRLRVLKEGSITLFGPNSQVCFKDPKNPTAAASCLSLAKEGSVTSTTTSLKDPTTQESMTISPVICTSCGGGELIDTYVVKYTTSYSGTKRVTEEIYYKHDNDPKVLIKTFTWDPATAPASTHDNVVSLSMASKPLGAYYILVTARTDDAYATGANGPQNYNIGGTNFIKLE